MYIHAHVHTYAYTPICIKFSEMLSNKRKKLRSFYLKCRLLLAASNDYCRILNHNSFNLNYPYNYRVAEGKSIAFPRAHKKIFT